MSFLLDVIIIAIIVFTVYRGVSRGFVKSAMKLLSFVIASLVAYYFNGTLANIYNEKFFSGMFVEKASDVITSVIQKTGEKFDIKTLFADMPEAFTDLLDRFGVSAGELELSFGGSDMVSSETITNMAERIAEPIARSLSTALAFATIFIGALIVLAVVTWILDLIFKLPVLKTANKLLGFLFGALCALLYAYLFSELAVVVVNAGIAMKPELFNENIVNNSILLKFFSEISIFSAL